MIAVLVGSTRCPTGTMQGTIYGALIGTGLLIAMWGGVLLWDDLNRK